MADPECLLWQETGAKGLKWWRDVHQNERGSMRLDETASAVELMRLPLWLKGFAEIAHFAKYFDEPLQHGYLPVGWLAHLKNH